MSRAGRESWLKLNRPPRDFGVTFWVPRRLIGEDRFMPTRRFRPARLARFGDFELDLRAGELRRDGAPVRLQEQPFRILTMLLEHPGEVVLRDEIRKRLWPNDTVVEIGHGINAAVLRLREALGESAENPRFIQTLPRRGYRFNGQVKWENGPPLTVPGETGGPAADGAEADITGRTVSHYRVLDRLGSGGMGVVYRAQDLQLGRQVALKFLSREFANDPAAREMFQREARAASALNHPNVCTVYSVEECAGQPVISMELVEGKTLSALLAKGPMPAAQALALGIQVAAALEAAHRKGVVHRDLKPGNLMVTGDPGRPGVKVLDFGIAKIDRPAARGAATNSSSGSGGGSGAIMGTPHYMSPEQQQGIQTDARSDIFCFGLVLYEMLTGRRASEDGRRVLTEVAPGIERVLSRCLAQDPDARWQTAGELIAELERVVAQSQAPAPPPLPEPRRTRSWWGPSAAAAALLLAGMLIGRMPLRPWRRTVPKPAAEVPPGAGVEIRRIPLGQTQTVTLHLPGQAGRHFTLTGPVEATATRLKLSPDGRSVAFLSGPRHYVRAFERAEAQVLYAPDGVGSPFWSPDGRSVTIAENGQLVRIGLAPGSLSTNLAPVNTSLDGAWGPDGTILIGRVSDGIYRIPASGGPPTRVTVPDAARGETRHLLPQFLPDGRRFLYLAGSDKPGGSLLWAGSLDSAERTQVMPMQSNFAFVPATPGDAKGYLVFLRDRVLVAQPFDSARLVPLAEPYALAPSVAANTAIGTLLSTGDFSATTDTLAYRSGNAITVVQNWLAEVPHADRPSTRLSSQLLPASRF
jgi:eukaryotic-like serine/threonine-protein kinase